VAGLCVYTAKTIVVDERHHQRLGSPHELEETIVHELVHVAAPASDHGLAHTVMLKRAMEYLRSLVAAPATARREREGNMDRTMDREEHATLRRAPPSLLAAMERSEA